MDVHVAILQQGLTTGNGVGVDEALITKTDILGGLHSARSLSIGFCGLLSPTYYIDISAASGLRELELRGYSPILMPIGPLTQVTSDSVSGIGNIQLVKLKQVKMPTKFQFSYQPLMDFLACAPSIEELVVNIAVRPYFGPDQTSDRHLVMHNLHTLDVTSSDFRLMGRSFATMFLSRIAAPSLQNISVCLLEANPIYSTMEASAIGEELVELIQRSALNTSSGRCAIRAMKFEGRLVGDWLIRVLPLLPDLETLELDAGEESETMLNALLRELGYTPAMYSDRLCPRLKDISISSGSLDENLIKSFLRARSQPSAQCECLRRHVFSTKKF